MRLLFLILLLFPAHAFPGDSIIVSDAWVSEGPPTTRVTAAYMDIVNNTDNQIDLITARSSLFERIEFHLTKMEGGIASMQKKDVITIPARSGFSFSPGQYHLMLFNSSTPLKAGDSIPLQLTFSNGESIDIMAEVKRVIPHEQQHH